MRLNKKLHSEGHEEHENDELWAISYGDMITLLLSFFVIYFSIDPKKNEMEKLDNHLISSFKMVDLKNSKNMPPSIKTDGSIKTLGDAPKFEALKNAKITKIDDRLLVTFDQMSFFSTAKVEPHAQGELALKEFAAKFLPYAGLYKISIKAFTDKRPVKNKYRFKDNMELSALRALSALRVLQKSGIPLDRMEIAGYGEMNKLHSLIDAKKLQELTDLQIKDLSRTIVLIIKHETEQSVL